jgi:sulfatase modifying factor 1
MCERAYLIFPLKMEANDQLRFEDGILLPEYRLPTEAEWEYAALALIGKQSANKDELITDRRIYPWDSNTVQDIRRRDKIIWVIHP